MEMVVIVKGESDSDGGWSSWLWKVIRQHKKKNCGPSHVKVDMS